MCVPYLKFYVHNRTKMHAQDKYVANIEIVRFLKQTHHWEIRINSNNHKLNIYQKIVIARCRVNPDLPGFLSRTL